MQNILLKCKLFWLSFQYKRMWNREQWSNWSTVADMPLKKKELLRAAKRGLVETRQVRDGYTNKLSTEYRFNEVNMGKFYIRQSILKTIKEKMFKAWKKKRLEKERFKKEGIQPLETWPKH